MASPDSKLEISEAELVQATESATACADAPADLLPEEWFGYDLPAGRQFLVILFAWHQSDVQRRTRYSAQYLRENPESSWQLRELNLSGEQRLPGEPVPIPFHGDIPPDVIERLVGRTRAHWDQVTGGAPLSIDGIDSSLVGAPCADRRTASGDAGQIRFAVGARSEQAVAPRSPAADNVLGFASNLAGALTFVFGQAPDRDPVLRDVRCGGADCDAELLRRLRAGLDDPSEPPDEAAILVMALESLPTEYAGAEVIDTHLAATGRMDFFTVELDWTSVSNRRTVKSSIRCWSEQGADWRCQHMVDAVHQTVPGLAQPVTVMGVGETISEPVVENAVLAIGEHVERVAGKAPWHQALAVHHLHFKGEQISALFSVGQGFSEAMLEYSGDSVSLVSVKELRQGRSLR